jgi:hypothetical protein
MRDAGFSIVTAAMRPLDAMLERIAADPHLPKIVSFDAMAIDGPAMAALTRVLRSRGSVPRILDRAIRPRLESDLGGKGLSRQGPVQFSPQEAAPAIDGGCQRKANSPRWSPAIRRPCVAPSREFLQMEASGWKGPAAHRAPVQRCRRSFARAAVGALADQGRACIHALYILMSRPVSMQIVLRAGAAAFTWKIAYDERLHDVSPGMLLLEDYTAAFLDDAEHLLRQFLHARRQRNFMSVWTEREAIANLWIDVRRGGSLAFELLWRLQKSLLRTARP